MTLLIVDDEPHIRHMMRLTLEAAGHRVEEAADGEDALVRFGDERQYDLIVLDQKLPGIDGLQTLRRIKEQAPGAPVLMVTAFASVELAVEAMKLGATDFLRKPMTPEVLRSAVAAALASGRPVVPIRAGESGIAKPAIQVLTLNGFQITLGSEGASASTAAHHFRVKRFADGADVNVTVTINPAAVSRVERLTRRRLEPGGAFWRRRAERLLSAYLWTEGRTPPGDQLTIDDVSREDLELAADWESD
jgi:DNA-binding response OmpR family regulator